MPDKQNYTRKYFIMGGQDVPEEIDAADLLQNAIQAGITAFEYRECGEDQLIGSDKINLGTELRKICKRQDVPFFVNDDFEMLKLLDADGIRITPSEDVKHLREQFPDKKIGLTITSKNQEDGGKLALVDYIAVGPVYEDLPHSEDKMTPIGLDLIKQLRTTYPTLDIVAFGGIGQQNAKEVIEAGASGVAVISAITEPETSIEDAIGNL